MPEGPEIRRAADAVARVLVGHEIVDVSLHLPGLKRFEKRLRAATVTVVDTRGKAMLTRFDNGLTLYSHNQLYGRWYTTRRPRLPRTRRQQRVALHTATHSALLYSASDVEILTATQEARHPFLKRIGPDILDPSLDKAAIVERLLAAAFRNRALGGLYLDQSFLAGNGNYLRSEILWSAGLHPKQRPADVPAAGLVRLAADTLTIARRSYRTRGVTAPPKAARERKALGMRYEQYRFQVYGRSDAPCYSCGTPIERLDSGSRAVFICPECQPG